MAKTSIQWTERTWNCLRGCSRVSPGCRECYAETIAARFSGPGQPFHLFAEREPEPHWTGKVGLIESKLDEPLHVRTPSMWFVNSMSDMFHESLPSISVYHMFAVMSQCPKHTFQILTKRGQRMCDLLANPSIEDFIDEAAGDFGWCHANVMGRWPLPNVWLGVSVESRPYKSRIDLLRETPAALRFLSIEPLLEDIGELGLRGIHWVIVGGESGPNARPFDIAWARSIIAQCRAADVACFVKQVGSFACEEHEVGTAKGGCHRPLTLRDSKGGDPAEWPLDLRVREMPERSEARRDSD